MCGNENLLDQPIIDYHSGLDFKIIRTVILSLLSIQKRNTDLKSKAIPALREISILRCYLTRRLFV